MASSSSISNREGTGVILAHGGVGLRHLYFSDLNLYLYAPVTLLSVWGLCRARERHPKGAL